MRGMRDEGGGMKGVKTPNASRRRFMIGAAGFTFGIVAGVPVLLRPEETRAQSAKSVAVNA